MMKNSGDGGKSKATLKHAVLVELDDNDIAMPNMALAIKIAEIFQSEIRTIVLDEAAIGRQCETNSRPQFANMADHQSISRDCTMIPTSE